MCKFDVFNQFSQIHYWLWKVFRVWKSCLKCWFREGITAIFSFHYAHKVTLGLFVRETRQCSKVRSTWRSQRSRPSICPCLININGMIPRALRASSGTQPESVGSARRTPRRSRVKSLSFAPRERHGQVDCCAVAVCSARVRSDIHCECSKPTARVRIRDVHYRYWDTRIE